MRSILINIFFAVSLLSQAQNKTIDSLKMALKNAKHDTTRCNILSAMIEAENDDAVWAIYNRQLNQIAESNLKTLSNNNPLIVFYKKYLAYSFNNDGFLSHMKGDNSKSLEYYKICIKIREEVNDLNGISETLNNIGGLYQSQGDIPTSLNYFSKSLKIKEEMYVNSSGLLKETVRNGIAISLSNIGSIYDSQGDVPHALEYYNKSLKIFEENNDKNGVANTLNNIATIYSNHSEPKVALDYLSKCLKIYEEINNKMGVAYTLNALGFVHRNLGDHAKAFDYFSKSLKIYEEIGSKSGVAKSLNNICVIFHNKGDLENALKFYGNSLKIQEEISDKRGISFSLNNIGGIYLNLAINCDNISKKQNYLKLAEAFVIRSMKISKELGNVENIKISAFALNKLYKATNNYKLALENYELFIQMRDSINNEENKKASIKSQLKYEYEKKSAADSVKAAEEKKVVDAQLKQEKTQRLALYGGLGLVGIFALFMVNRFRVTNKQKKLIEEQKKVVEAQKHLVEEKQKEIIDSITYARRIQRALITNEHYIKQHILRLMK